MLAYFSFDFKAFYSLIWREIEFDSSNNCGFICHRNIARYFLGGINIIWNEILRLIFFELFFEQKYERFKWI